MYNIWPIFQQIWPPYLSGHPGVFQPEACPYGRVPSNEQPIRADLGGVQQRAHVQIWKHAEKTRPQTQDVRQVRTGCWKGGIWRKRRGFYSEGATGSDAMTWTNQTVYLCQVCFSGRKRASWSQRCTRILPLPPLVLLFLHPPLPLLLRCCIGEGFFCSTSSDSLPPAPWKQKRKILFTLLYAHVSKTHNCCTHAEEEEKQQRCILAATSTHHCCIVGNIGAMANVI